MKGKIISGIVAVAFAILFLWLGLWRWNIPFNFNGFGPFSYYFIFVIGAPITIFLLGVAIDRDEGYGWMAAPWAIWVLVMIIGGIASSPMANARSYATQISIPESKPFADSDLPAFDPTKIPWVDEAYAQVLGDKRIGELGAIGSSVQMGEYVRQEVNGDLFFVAPILHSGFFKYNASPGGTPGYVMVSMTNDDDVRLITDHKIRVQPAGHAAWDDKLQRIVNQIAPSALRYQYKFEVDDDFHPWWVVPIYQNQVGWWGGAEITGVVIVDATDGRNAKLYNLNEVPEWVDRVYPTELIEKQTMNWGQYVNGFWNTVFGKTGMLQIDPGNAIVYDNGNCYLFNSLTSHGGSDESTVGFVLTNLRTKETRQFSRAGATEYAAQLSAIGDDRVKAQNYAATFPLPTVIEGQITYFMALTDPNSHLVKAFAFVNMSRHQIVGIGNTIRAAEADYRTKLHSTGATNIYTPTADLLEIEGEILRWGQYVQGGHTFYQFIVSGYEDRLFTTDSSKAEATITKEGDRVQLRVMKTDNASWTVFTFDNLEFTQTLGPVEQVVTEAEIEQQLEAIKSNPAVMDDSRFQDFWNSLTPEQQAEFLNRAGDDN